MRHTVVILFCLLSIHTFAWKPLAAGHRGGYTGVENTRESYINGVTKYGYSGLECDVMTTKDGKLVVCHDNSTERFGGNLEISKSTLAQLQAENWTQTRGGVTYTGKICTLDEYLQICEDYNVFPIIELKGSAGIYQTDMSKFPEIYALIEAHHLVDKAYILTSMSSSLEYVRTNYPLIKCMYLCYTLPDGKIDWCKKWGIHPDCGVGGLDQHIIKRCKDAGLTVATWCVNNLAQYKEYAMIGVDIITCDYLYLNEMPDIPDIDWNEVKPFTTKIELKPISELDSLTAKIDSLKNDSIEFMIDEHILLITKDGQGGAWKLQDMSCVAEPKLHIESTWGNGDTEGIQVTRINESTVNVFVKCGEQVKGWYVSTQAPLHPATSVSLNFEEVTLAVGDTVEIIATVLPENCTSEMSWKIDQARAITVQHEGYKAKLIGRVAKDAILTITIDDLTLTCPIHCVKELSDIETIESDRKSQKILRNGTIIILKDKEEYTTTGMRVN